MIVIVDYGMGNVASVANAFLKLGFNPKISSEVEDVKKASYLVLPGVGAFEDAIRILREAGLADAIRKFIESGRPFLGICLGMHLLFEKSYENGEFEGLGILKGEVVRFNTELPVPHMGWNSIRIKTNSYLFDGVENGAFFYFDHSYYAVPLDRNVVALECHYGIDFPAAVINENIVAFQFHPEKSHNRGLKLLSNFLKLQR